jgi:hypothetical protein
LADLNPSGRPLKEAAYRSDEKSALAVAEEHSSVPVCHYVSPNDKMAPSDEFLSPFALVLAGLEDYATRFSQKLAPPQAVVAIPEVAE